jgi:hypothetical protein
VTVPLFHIEQLPQAHDRSSFTCGNERIDKSFLRNRLARHKTPIRRMLRRHRNQNRPRRRFLHIVFEQCCAV